MIAQRHSNQTVERRKRWPLAGHGRPQIQTRKAEDEALAAEWKHSFLAKSHRTPPKRTAGLTHMDANTIRPELKSP